MNVKKGIFILFITLLTSNLINGQANLLNATIPEEIGVKTADQDAADNDKPLPYGFIDDRDILWSKMVWEYIDLNEKINLPFYYPSDTSNIESSRRSLYDTLLRGIKAGDIVDVYDDSYFENRLTLKEVKQSLSKIDTTDAGIEKLNFGEELLEEDVNIRDLISADIEGFKIKGLYYFDKRQGELKYRLLGIAPVSPDVNFIDDQENNDVSELVELFWVWYPGVRDIMHEMKVFNQKNSAFPLSYDLLLNARRFNAIIYREENVYGNRDVSSYIKNNALFQVLESIKVREHIRDYELDMWNY
ncbi:MAG: gliding motility protein GldN [Flavobacteriaceae bacterium]|nr:gliding motility protein GldN [Flavobacteriaceae bacterium]